MRYNDFKISKPVEELAKRLVKIGPDDYNAIKKLINHVSISHELSSDKLHHMFVSKYGHTPDTWIRKIKQRNEEVNEDSNDYDTTQVEQFIEWSYKTLNIQEPKPKFQFSRDTEEAQEQHRTGMHDGDGNITVYVENRNLVDIFRTIFHELVHHRQDQLGMIKDGDSYPGSPIEAMADMMAGKYIKIYGKEHPEIFQ